MKRIIISTFVLGAFLVSCSSGNKAETGEAQEVPEVTTEEANTYNTIEANSHITWRATHLGGTAPRFGKVTPKEASVSVVNGEVKNAKFVFDMNSLTVENFDEGDEKKGQLTTHLKSADFFNVESNPVSTFELTNIGPADGEFNSTVTGNLTIMDSTKSITFKASIEELEGALNIKSEKFTVDRSDWGLVYNAEGTKGVPADYLIADPIEFSMDIVLKK